MRHIFLLVILLNFNQALTQEVLPLRIQSGHSSNISSTAFSPNGKWLATGSWDATVILWDIATGKEITRFIKGSNPVVHLEFSPDGAQLLASYEDHKIIVWEIETGKTLNFITCIRSENCIGYVDGGKHFIAGSCNEEEEEVFQLISSSTFKKVRVYKSKVSEPKGIAISKSGKAFASVGNDFKIQLWSIQKSEPVSSINVYDDLSEYEPVYGPKRLTCLTISADEKYIAIGNDGGQIFIVDGTQKKVIRKFNFHSQSIFALRFTPDGKSLLVASTQNPLILIDAVTGDKMQTLTNHCLGFSFSTDLKRLAAGGSMYTTHYMYVTELYDASFRKIQTFEGKGLGSSDIGISPDGRSMAFLSKYDQVCLWDLAIAKPIRYLTNTSGKYIGHIIYGHDNQHLFTAGRGNIIDKWDVNSGKNVHQFVLDKKTSIVNGISISNNGKWLAAGGTDSILQVFDAISGTEWKKIKTPNWVYALSFNSNSTLLATGAYGNKIKVLDRQTFETKSEFDFGKEENTVSALHFLNDKSMVASGFQKQIKTFTLNQASANRTFQKGKEKYEDIPEARHEAHSNGIYNLSLNADSNLVASSGGDFLIRLWGLNGVERKTFKGHTDNVHQALIHPNNKILISLGGDKTIKFWDIESEKLVCSLIVMGNEENDHVFFTPDGYYMGTKKGVTDLIHFSKQNKIYQFDQFDLKYNRPDIILKRIDLASADLIKSYQWAYEKRLKKLGFDPANFEKELNLNVPEVTFDNLADRFAEVSSSDFKIDIIAKDARYNLDRLTVTVNGVPFHGSRGLDLKNIMTREIHTSVTVNLSSGKNRIEISALNEKGVESLKEALEVNYVNPKSTKPSLYLVCIGVSQYKNQTMNLNFAAKDGLDILKAFEQKKDVYSHVYKYELLNENATRENILKIKNELLHSSVDDVVLIFVSGHGVLDHKLDYYLGTHDIDFNLPAEKGLPYEDLESLLDGIPARQKVLLMDACHSGEFDKEEVTAVNKGQATNGPVKFRNFGLGLERNTIGLQNSFELSKQLFNDLRVGSGTTVISAAGGMEFAIEGDKWKNGVFTYSLLTGLQDGLADLNGDKQITLSEIQKYLYIKVPQLTDGRQKPTTRIENLSNDFRIW